MLPHIQNMEAGRNKYDPAFNSMFEFGLTVPAALQQEFGADAQALISEQIVSVDGLDGFFKGLEAGEQKFHGVSKSYLKPVMDQTHVEFSIKLNMNLRNGTDNYVYKLFKAWQRLGYNLRNGERHLTKDCTADWASVRVANQTGDVWEEIVMKDIMLVGDVKLFDSVDYSNSEALILEVKFRTDWWDEETA